MKVVLLNTSDSQGGAAIVTFRLMQALCREGVDARMLVVDRCSDSDRVDVAGTPEQRKWAFLTERLKIWVGNGFLRRDLFKVSIANAGVDVLSHEWVQRADIVCLNWINQGMLSLFDMQRLFRMKKTVWTMHDMWCCTGICHHAYDCRNYTGQCGHCQYLRFRYGSDLSHHVWKKKKRIFDEADVHFVAVSNWLADRCRESSLLAGKPVSVIANALPVGHFEYGRKDSGKEKVIAMGAARLDDAVKGFELLIQAANLLAEKEIPCRLLLFGDIRDRGLLQQIKLPYEWLGKVPPKQVPAIYRRSDVVVSSSHFETLPTTLIEGQAAGCLAVAFDHGGQRDIITHKKDGYLAAYPDANDLADGLQWAVSQNQDRRKLHDHAVSRFSETVIAQAYIRLFGSL